MSHIRMVAIDIDGTLLTTNRQFSPAVQQAVREASARGVKIVLATGRPLKGVLPLLEELGLLRAEEYVITYNGALVQAVESEQVIADYSLSRQDFFKIEELANELGVPYHVADRHALYTTNRNIGLYTTHESWLVQMPICYRTLDEMAEEEIVFQKMMMVAEPHALDAAIAQLPEWMYQDYTVVKSAPFYLEILHPEANKGAAVQALAQHLGIAMTEVMAIGDNHNDLDMLLAAGLRVAMDNAVPEVKQIATHVVPSNDEDGVAVALRTYVTQ